MNKDVATRDIQEGKTVLGLELGSTRIKAVLIGEGHAPIAGGEFGWENRLENGIWTYSLEDVWKGIQAAYAALAADVKEKYGLDLSKIAGFGVSAMMHGYLPFDKDGKQLADFRTWRNTTTEAAATELTQLLDFAIPQRWSIAHLYQAMLNGEGHVEDVAFLTTLAGYVHWQLTGERVMGVGEASGMFPIDSETGDFDQRMIDLVDAKVKEKGYSWRLRDILPQVLGAGEDAGQITLEGAKLIDPSGVLLANIPVAPPEGDAGTGMTATNAVAARTGNVSAGTSVFAMVVLEKPLSKVYPEIDMVTTPTGKPVAMVHCNNCTSDINAWAGMLKGFAEAAGLQLSMNDVFSTLFISAMKGAKDCNGIINIPYLSGEPVTGLSQGRPMLVRGAESGLAFSDFARSLLSGAMASLKIGMEILAREQVKMEVLFGHGGYFKTPLAGQKILSAALDTPISVMETAGEGGPWGMALLAAYRVRRSEGESLGTYLKERVFATAQGSTISPETADVEGFTGYTQQFQKALKAQEKAVEWMK